MPLFESKPLFDGRWNQTADRAAQLRYLLDQTGDTRTAVAAYYQGLRSVRAGTLLPDTKLYVAAVLATVQRFS